MDNKNSLIGNTKTGECSNIQQQQQSQDDVMEAALCIHLVVQNVLRNLQLPDLKSCRLVNQMWRTISSSIISSRDCCEVVILFDHTEKDFRHYRQLHRKWGTSPTGKIPEDEKLASLNSLVKNSSSNNNNFPCTSFSFHWGDLGQQEVQEFLDIYGQKIQSLQLIRICDPDSCTTKQNFQQLLCRQAPNIQNLIVNGFDYEFEEDDLVLPILKEFTWENCSNIAYEIMRAAPNLEAINTTNYYCDKNNTFHLPLVIKAGKAHTIKQFCCDPSTDEELNGLSQFLSVDEEGAATHDNNNINELTFVRLHPFQVERRRNLCLQLLESNKDSLRVLNLSKSFGFLRVNIPRLDKLKTLKLGLPSDTQALQIVFPPMINLTQTFPHVDTLDFTHFRPNFPWQQLFPPSTGFLGHLSTVRRLEIGDGCSEIFLEKLHTLLCPNFKTLIVNSQPSLSCREDGTVNLPVVLAIVFRIFQHLESLEVNVKGQRYEYFSIDSEFTGLSTDTCSRLEESYSSDDELETGFQGLKIRPAIYDLKELKFLTIRLECSSYYMLDKVSIKRIPISWVSCRYAFQLLSGLKVRMLYDQSCLNYEGAEGLKSQFDSIAPFVTLSHKQFYKGG